ncbi:hypothetical protein ABT354_36310 [Streptomyces sp. NPDC000594]|uniref:hypothetical protein n=1 Tax=Streptomyces sp. NPDC000594 TaxID=3154261 RepID=UPI00331BBF97
MGSVTGPASRISVLAAYDDPREVAREDFRPWSAAVAMTEAVEYAIPPPAARALDRLDPDRWRRHARIGRQGALVTTNPVIGILGPMAARARTPGQEHQLDWVDPYTRSLRAHDYRVVRPDRECVLNAGRPGAELWRLGRESTQGNSESAVRFAFLTHTDAVPVDMRIAISALWCDAALADQRYSGETCAREAGKMFRIALDHLFPHLEAPGAREAVWERELDLLLINMLLRLTGTYHDPSGLTLGQQLSMRSVDSGASAQMSENAFYNGLTAHPLLQEWTRAFTPYHDIWQIQHDEKKPDHNLNICSALLRHGIGPRALADYLTYLTCSTELPHPLHQLTDGWAVMTLTSLRHDSRLPTAPPVRSHGHGLWDEGHVRKVKAALGTHHQGPLSGPDPALTGGDLDLAELRALTDPENCRSYTACTRNMATAVDRWRQYVHRYDIFPAALAHSRYASRPD